METKHTPGPWHVFKIYNGKDSWGNDSYDVGIYSDTVGVKIATVETWIGKTESIECDANAALIASATVLLEALMDALKDLEALSQWDNASACARKARAAIAKATGE